MQSFSIRTKNLKNFKKVAFPFNLSKSCHELIELIVCSRYEKDCMVHRCDNCPGTTPLISFLEKELVKNKHDGDEEIDDGDVES